MDLNFQKTSIDELKQLAESDRHSILIEGPVGCGKSYLSRQYAKMLNIFDIVFIQPNVTSIREALEKSSDLSSPTVFCIENLDIGVVAASYTLLKFLEEPTSNVYIVVTCRNRYQIPDTIISRSTCISVGQPTKSDVNNYAEQRDPKRYKDLKSMSVWNGVRSLMDVDYVFNMKSEHINYYTTLKSEFKLTNSVTNLVWKLGHYPDNTETNILFVLNYLMSIMTNRRIKKYIIECIRELSTSRIASHAVLAKFLLNCKYGE